MSPVVALAGKDLRLLVRDRGGFFFTLVWPLVFAIVFGSVFSRGPGDDGGVPVALVDEDQSDGSKALVERLEKGDEVEVMRVDTRDEARDLVRRGKRAAFVAIPRGFGDAQQRFVGATPSLVVGNDPSRRAEAGLLGGVLVSIATEQRFRAMTDPATASLSAADARKAAAVGGASPELVKFLSSLEEYMGSPAARGAGPGGATGNAFRPVAIESADVVVEHSGPTNAFSVSFPQGIVWGLIGACAAFGLSIVVERTRGTLVRLVVAPLSRLDVLLGKALACVVTALALGAALVTVGCVVFGVRVASWPLLVVAFLCAGVCFAGLQTLIATLGRTEASVSGIGWAVLLGMAMFGGGMVPFFAMPRWMKAASVLSPVRWSIEAMEGAIWRGYSLAEMALPCAVLLGVGIVAFTIGTRTLRWSDR